jgi:hypothetical protein
MLRIDRLGNRVVVMTVVLVALAGLLVGVGSYLRTRSLAGEYEKPCRPSCAEGPGVRTDGAKCVALSALSPAALEVGRRGRKQPQGQSRNSARAQSSEHAARLRSLGKILRWEVSALIRHDVPVEEVPPKRTRYPLLISQTAATRQPAQAPMSSMGTSTTFLIRLGGQPSSSSL